MLAHTKALAGLGRRLDPGQLHWTVSADYFQQSDGGNLCHRPNCRLQSSRLLFLLVQSRCSRGIVAFHGLYVCHGSDFAYLFLEAGERRIDSQSRREWPHFCANVRFVLFSRYIDSWL